MFRQGWAAIQLKLIHDRKIYSVRCRVFAASPPREKVSGTFSGAASLPHCEGKKVPDTFSRPPFLTLSKAPGRAAVHRGHTSLRVPLIGVRCQRIARIGDQVPRRVVAERTAPYGGQLIIVVAVVGQRRAIYAPLGARPVGVRFLNPAHVPVTIILLPRAPHHSCEVSCRGAALNQRHPRRVARCLTD